MLRRDRTTSALEYRNHLPIGETEVQEYVLEQTQIRILGKADVQDGDTIGNIGANQGQYRSSAVIQVWRPKGNYRCIISLLSILLDA